MTETLQKPVLFTEPPSLIFLLNLESIVVQKRILFFFELPKAMKPFQTKPFLD